MFASVGTRIEWKSKTHEDVSGREGGTADPNTTKRHSQLETTVPGVARLGTPEHTLQLK